MAQEESERVLAEARASCAAGRRAWSGTARRRVKPKPSPHEEAKKAKAQPHPKR